MASDRNKSLVRARTWGLAGSLIALAGGLAALKIPGPGALAIAGSALVLVAMKRLSEAVSEGRIFRDYLLYFVLGAAAIAAVLGASGAATGQAASGAFSRGLDALLGGFAAAWAVFLVAVVFLWKCYGTVAAKTGVRRFKWAALLYLAGAALLIAGVGFVVLLAALVLQVLAFCALPSGAPAPGAKG